MRILFFEKFNNLLSERKISPLKLAKEISVPKSVVYEWKKGKREPSVENMVKLAEYFSVSLEYLTGRKEPLDYEDNELIVMLRAAKEISPHDHDELVESFKKNLSVYLRSKGVSNDEK